MSFTSSALALVGRILLALIFVSSGAQKLMGWPGIEGEIASKGLPAPQVLAALTILIELVGGVLVVLGWKARWAAFIIFLFLIPVTSNFHNFWVMVGAARMGNEINFWKNVAIMGGMLLLAAYGPGRYSVDRR